MSGRDEDLEAQLADHGDDRPGIDDLEGDDFSALQIDDDDELDDDLDDEDDDDLKMPTGQKIVIAAVAVLAIALVLSMIL